MTVVGSRYGSNNQYVVDPGKGFTVICNDCGLMQTENDFSAVYCVFCDLVAVIKCHGCNQESHIHNSVICERETNYVQENKDSLGQLRDSPGGEQL